MQVCVFSSNFSVILVGDEIVLCFLSQHQGCGFDSQETNKLEYIFKFHANKQVLLFLLLLCIIHLDLQYICEDGILPFQRSGRLDTAREISKKR